MVIPPVELDDLKQHLNITSSTHDQELTQHLASATDTVEARCGPMAPREISEVTSTDIYGMVLTEQHPVLTVTSAQPRGGEAITDVDTSWSRIDVGEVELDWPETQVRITYSAGREPVPDDLRLAVLIVAGHLWETQRGPSTNALSAMGEDAGMGAQTSYIRAQGFALPRRAMELMFAYQRVRLP